MTRRRGGRGNGNGHNNNSSNGHNTTDDDSDPIIDWDFRASDMSTDYVDGFLRYDVFPQNSFAKRDLPVPRLGRAHEVRGGNTKPLRALAWSCDGRRVATGTEMKGLRVWEVSPRSGSPHAVIVDAASSFALPSSSKVANPHNGHIAALAWSPTDPDVLVSGCKGSAGGGVVVVWDVSRPSSPPTAILKITGDVLHIAFHPSGAHFAVVCPRSTRDEVYFFRKDADGWVQRQDILMGGVGIDIGVEEINSLRFWLGGDALMSVSNDGSLTSWWYPVAEREGLPAPEPREEIDERPAKKSRVESPAAAPTPDAAAEGGDDADADAPEREVSDDGEGREAVEAEAEEGEPEAAAEGEGGAEGAGEDGKAEGDVDVEKNKEEKPGLEIKVEGPDGDVEMADATPVPGRTPAPSAPGSAAPSAPPSAPASAAPSAPASAAPSAPASRQPTPQPTPPNEAAEAAAAAAANELKLAEKRAAAAADLAARKHKQLALCYRQVPHVASLLALAIDPLGRFLAIGGQDARVSLLSTTDWSVQRNFDAPTAAIRHAAFSPDGELLAVGGDDACIFVFSVFARTTIAKINVTGSVNALAWSPKRNVLAYSTNSKVGVVWHIVHQE